MWTYLLHNNWIVSGIDLESRWYWFNLNDQRIDVFLLESRHHFIICRIRSECVRILLVWFISWNLFSHLIRFAYMQPLVSIVWFQFHFLIQTKHKLCNDSTTFPDIIYEEAVANALTNAVTFLFDFYFSCKLELKLDFENKNDNNSNHMKIGQITAL